MRCSVVTALAMLALSARSTSSAGAEQVPLNLALGKPATASATQSGNSPGSAADGDNGTRWCAADSSPGHWWQVDLQQPEDLTSCRINWEFDGVRYRYKVEASPDGMAWATLVNRTGGDAPARRDQAHKLDAKAVRFVRVTVTGLETGRWASFHELELYGGGKTVDPTTLARRKNASLLREIKAPAGLKVTLFAAPPDVSYPVCLAAAANGDVFVAVDPNGSLDQKTGRGKILRCRDTDADGAADEFVTFAQLDSPRGMVWDEANATMYVVHPPFLRAYRDENLDGVSERNDVLVEGLGYDLNFRGADHTTNGMQIGIDGWLYIAVGDYGFVKATGKDGKSLQLHGGGVVRVRPDGTRLEIVTRGQRNIYDVAISPTLDLFTRDNTNDGDGWDERLSHVVPLANFGYPSLFKNFSAEVMKPLAEYGGGSPTGSIYLDEPGLARGLFTCDWGTNRVDLHPLARKGASFTAGQKSFIELPRPIDIDVDGQSRLYVASWRGGGFAYSGSDVGYVVRLVDPGQAPVPPLDYKRASDEALVKQLASDSHVRRLAAQREILRRGVRPGINDAIANIAFEDGPIERRVAALFTMTQLGNPAADLPNYLRPFQKDEQLREFVVRAASDMQAPTENDYVPHLYDANPRVRLQALHAAAAHGTANIASHVLRQVGDTDPVLAHCATKAAITIGAVNTYFEMLDDAAERDLVPGIVRVLQGLQTPEVVDGFLGRLKSSADPARRRLILAALCRLHYREAEWTGGWWGTRPDTSGPY